VPDVEGDHRSRAPLEQYLSEPTCGRTDIERNPTRDLEAEGIERSHEFVG
jgi:hypothetical protein